MKHFLTIDNGGTNTKVVIFDEAGTQVAVKSFPTKGLEYQAGFHEIDLHKLQQDLGQAIPAALAQAKLTGDQIDAVATVGHGKGLYTLDKDKQVFMNGILSADSRAEAYANKFERQVSTIFPISHQHVMPSQAPLLLRWLKDHQPEKYAQIGYVLSNKDFIGYLLTGEVKQELGDASGNNLINLETAEYDRRLLDFFGIEEMADKLPELIHATDLRGRISPAAAQLTGLTAGTPVFGGMFDIDACAVATGVLDDTKLSLIAGTWNMNIFPSDHLASDESGLMNSIFPTGKYLWEASSPTSAGNLAIILKMLMTAEMRDAEDAGRSIYDNLEDFLENTDAAFAKVIFFPFLYGSNVSPDAEGTFIGLRSTTTKSEMIRAVYEGIAFAHRYHVENLVRALGHRPAVIRMSGGACNSPSWVQMFSDILNTPIELVSANELGGLGGAITAAVGLGDYATISEAAQKMSRVLRRYEPRPDQVKMYDEKYRVYRQMQVAMDPVWASYHHMQNQLVNRAN